MNFSAELLQNVNFEGDRSRGVLVEKGPNM